MKKATLSQILVQSWELYVFTKYLLIEWKDLTLSSLVLRDNFYPDFSALKSEFSIFQDLYLLDYFIVEHFKGK